MNKTKAQVALEFLMLTGLALAIAITFSVASLSEIQSIRDQQRYQALSDVAASIERELSLAAYVEEGYYREINLPVKALSEAYNITIINDVLTVHTEDSSVERSIPLVQGNLTPGINAITKTGNGIVVGSVP